MLSSHKNATKKNILQDKLWFSIYIKFSSARITRNICPSGSEAAGRNI